MKKLLAITLTLFAACGSHDKGTPQSGNPPTGTHGADPQNDLPDGLDLRVSNGKAGAPPADHTKLAPVKKLGDADANALLTRAKPIATDPADKAAFALRPKSAPPPKTGTTVAASFPPPASSLLPPPAASDAGAPLRVLRYMPEGQVPLAPELSVTFSAPMVAVTSQTDAAATTPVKLSPQPKGRWRWIGTRTILFDPEVRFPQATTYTIDIPAGTKSATGAALAAATHFTFETPAPTLVSSYPGVGESQRLDAPMFALFDQRIDPEQVLAHVRVEAGGHTFAVRALAAAEIAKDKQLAALTDAARANEQEGRWIAFRATAPFPADAAVTVTIAAGTPSAEGPNPTKAPQVFAFHTYPPLAVAEATCGEPCRPSFPFVIRFNNPLDADLFHDDALAIDPALPGARIMAQGTSIVVQGATTARTAYRVTVPASLADRFGQTLGAPRTLTFNVGDAQPTFFGPSGLVVLDPAAKAPTLDFFSTGYAQLKIKLYRVDPSDYDAWGAAMRGQWDRDHVPKMPGKLVTDSMIDVGPAVNSLSETSLDLAPALSKAGLGHAIAVVEPSPWREAYAPPRMIAWVQATKLAVDAHVDADQLIAFASELDTGKAAPGVALELRPFGIAGKTDDSGLATLALAAPGPKGPHLLIARRGDDVAFLAEQQGYWSEGGSWNRQPRERNVAWYVFDDRKLYKPGEEVSLKGWLRIVDAGKGGDVGALGGAVTAVAYTVTDSQGNQIAKGSAPVSTVGGFDAKFTLPKTPNLGYTAIQFSTVGSMRSDYGHAIQVEEFRRPEFEVSAQASQGPFLVGGGGDVTVSAKYFAGGPLPGAEVSWSVVASQTSFTPPNRDEYTFGAWTPWWGGGYRGGFDDEFGGGMPYQPPHVWSLASKTDATGAHILHMDFLSAKPSVPMAVQTNASVTDVNRQQWSAGASLIVHPSSLYVGLRTARPFVDKGTPFALDVIGVDLDGKAAPGAKIDVRAVRLDWEYVHGQYKTKEVDPQACAVVAAADAVPCTFQTKEGGQYQVTATITDDKGRANQSTMSFWVSGGNQPPAREVQQEVAQLIPDRKEYADGQTAELLVQAPFYPAEGVVTWRRSGIVKTERISLTGPTATVKVPITDAMVPNLYVQVDLVGAAARADDHGQPDPKLPKRPAYAVGSIDLPVPPKQRTLKVSVTPAAAKLGPGEQTHLAVAVVDAAGKPVADAEVAVVVVDEAILSLAAYDFPDPIGAFYGQRGPDARDAYMRAQVRLAKPDITKIADVTLRQKGMDRAENGVVTLSANMDGAMAGSGAGGAPGSPPPPPPAPPAADMAPTEAKPMVQPGPMGGKSGGEHAPAAIAIRTNFNPLAAFAPAVKTDAAGHATVAVTMPDNLTRYRIVAVAAAGARQFGKGESAVTARLPLMVRPSPPRFLNFGDTFQLPVVVQNQTDSPMTVRVAVRATNAAITDGAGRELSVPANDRVEVQFPASAELAGTARFQIIGAAGTASDAAEVALPVWTPATTEAFATYGVIDDGAVKQPVALPGAVVTTYGGLEVTTSSTNLASLTDAVLYLVHYPFECAEQRSSRILAIAALKDVLAAFQAKDLPSASAMQASVTADIEHLVQMQNYDGGFAYWERGYPSEPYLSVYVASALGNAAKKGFVVDPAITERAKNFLREIESHYPSYYGKDVRWAISAYALYTRKQLGDLDVAKAKKLVAEAGADKLPMEAAGWLIATLAGEASAADERKALMRYALNKVSETAGAANFTTGYGDGNYLLLSSDRRVDAVMLDALIQESKDSDLIPKIVTGLLAHKKAGRWLNTQENTFALLALDRYFNTYEKTTPDFVARVWLGADYAGDHAFHGRTTEQFQLDVPMKDVATHDKSDLTIQKDGAGRLYYRVGMTYAPASLKLDAADYGFVVERKYEGVDDQADVQRLADGTWHIKAGARVRVRLSMVNENRRYHVALVDPLPAGLEPMNPALATTGPLPQDPADQKARGAYWWWYGPWYEHQNLRDERVEAFTQMLWEGVHAYTYVARATTPGHFIVPPTKAEEMYMPETFGRGASDRVIVE